MYSFVLKLSSLFHTRIWTIDHNPLLFLFAVPFNAQQLPFIACLVNAILCLSQTAESWFLPCFLGGLKFGGCTQNIHHTDPWQQCCQQCNKQNEHLNDPDLCKAFGITQVGIRCLREAGIRWKLQAWHLVGELHALQQRPASSSIIRLLHMYGMWLQKEGCLRWASFEMVQIACVMVHAWRTEYSRQVRSQHKDGAN